MDGKTIRVYNKEGGDGIDEQVSQMLDGVVTREQLDFRSEDEVQEAFEEYWKGTGLKPVNRKTLRRVLLKKFDLGQTMVMRNGAKVPGYALKEHFGKFE